MKLSDIAQLRLSNQKINNATAEKPADVVRHLGAVQAQDFLGLLWAVGLRMKNSTEKLIEKAISERKIVRTWPMRGTLHYVTAEDVRWMLTLMTPRVIAGTKTRIKNLGLDDGIFLKSKKALIKALSGGNALTRKQIYEVLERNKIPSSGQCGNHILGRLAQERLLCFGPRRGKQPTFVLMDEWIPETKDKSREEALAEITLRYFTGHGPATIQDMMWWSGLTATDIRNGLSMVKSKLIEETIDGKTYFMFSATKSVNKHSHKVYLLPPFDEYIVGYKNRDAVLEEVHKQKVNPGSNGMFSPIIVIDGQVVGTWKRTFKKGGVVFSSHPFVSFTKQEQEAVEKAASDYAKFIGLPLFF